MAIKIAVSMVAGFAVSLTSIGQGLAYQEIFPSRSTSTVEEAPLQLAQTITLDQAFVNACRISNGSFVFSREAGTGQRLSNLRTGIAIFLTGRVSRIEGQGETWVQFSNVRGGEAIGWVDARTLTTCGSSSLPTQPPPPRLTVDACAVVVDQVGSAGLSIRRSPSTSAPMLGTLLPGSQIVLSTQTRLAETRRWVRLIDRRFAEAWISETGANQVNQNISRVECISSFGVREGQQF